MTLKRILVVEDDDVKWRDIAELIGALAEDVECTRAESIVVAEKYVESHEIVCLVLDISMNIAGESAASTRGMHANLGGVEIAERMWLLGIDVPTVILTGFDYFRKAGSKSQTLETYSLEGLES